MKASFNLELTTSHASRDVWQIKHAPAAGARVGLHRLGHTFLFVPSTRTTLVVYRRPFNHVNETSSPLTTYRNLGR